jgi:hypothetical protein
MSPSCRAISAFHGAKHAPFAAIKYYRGSTLRRGVQNRRDAERNSRAIDEQIMRKPATCAPPIFPKNPPIEIDHKQ